MRTKKTRFNPIEASVRREASSYGFKKVLVALSGGADSIATIYAIKKCELDILALHCNFHIRAEESDRDMEFVKEFCNKENIKLEIIEFDVPAYRKINKGCSTEMACRNLRHEWFRKILYETGYDRIATGHNADDNIETFFLNLLRGSGSRGLKGMTADTGTIWRPLLSFHKNDIKDYLKENNLPYVTDSTNLKCDYRRNFLRNKIIPLFKQEWKGFDTAMDKSLKNLFAENNLIENVLQKMLPSPLEPLSDDIILDSPAPLLMIKRFIDPIDPFSTTAEEILSAMKAKKPHIRRWKLKKGVAFLRNGNLFIEMGHCESGS